MVALLVILTIVLALAVDSWVLARERRTAAVPAQVPLVAMKVPQPPQGIFLDAAHTWLRITSDGRLRVGIDDFLAEAVGQVDRVEVLAQGTTIERGSPLFTLFVKGRKLVGAAATHFLREELHRLADFMVPTRVHATVPVMADGGLPGKGAAASLDDESWQTFAREFVNAPAAKPQA